MLTFLSGLAAASFAAATVDLPVTYRPIVKQVVVPANADSAWSLWTTNEGFKSFFPGGPRLTTNIKLTPGGPYEVFLLPDNPEGSRGCDGCVILGYQAGRMLSFTWTNRPDMAVRPHRTNVVLTFETLSTQETRVTLVQDGWGVGPDWDVAHDYFDKAWGNVLAAYKARIDAACSKPASTSQVCQIPPG